MRGFRLHGFRLDPRVPRSQPRRRRRYFLLMGSAVLLFVLAGTVVYPLSAPAAVAMCVVAAVLPPLAAITGNRWEEGDKWWDEF
ncbi:DUF3099 domain-containing protein [Streptomyces synnematoformans]|uniref:DUF3099 domain-containing protein n=1 Tax=Streptomyces synnematoformans TaxID=415721 RepID=A0ABN1ZIQ0_9ACTN